MRSLDKVLIVEGFGFGAVGADASQVEGAVASASEILNRGHRCTAEFTDSATPLDHLPLGALRNPAFTHREASTQNPPEPLAKCGLLVRFENEFGRQSRPKLAHEGRHALADLRTIWTRQILAGSIAVGTKVAVHFDGFQRLTCMVEEDMKDAPRLVFKTQIGVGICGKGSPYLFEAGRDNVLLLPDHSLNQRACEEMFFRKQV